MDALLKLLDSNIGTYVIYGVVAIFLVFVYLIGNRGEKQVKNRKRKLMQNGVLAPAIIVSARKNRFIYEHQHKKYLEVTYHVNVQPEGKPPFENIFTDIVDIREFDNAAIGVDMPEDVGQILWVRYNPDVPRQMMFEYYEKDRQVIMGRRAYGEFEKRKRLIKETGVDAVAVLLEVEDMKLQTRYERNVIALDGQITRFKLEVTTRDGNVFQAETQGRIRLDSLNKYVVGRKVAVKLDPNDKLQVAIVRALDE